MTVTLGQLATQEHFGTGTAYNTSEQDRLSEAVC